MAESCQIQKTYISKILNNVDAHFSQDQLFKVCEYLKLSEEKKEFAMLLLDHAKSQYKNRKELIRKQISAIRNQKIKKTDSHIETKNLNENSEYKDKYYTNPYFQLVHMFLTIPNYAKKPSLIKTKLAMDDSLFQEAVNTLEKLDLISLKEGKVYYHGSDLHLSEDSPLFRTYSNALRSLGLSKIYSLDSENKYNFSVVFSANENTKNQIRLEFLEFLKKIKPLVEKSKEEHVYQLDFNFFLWS